MQLDDLPRQIATVSPSLRTIALAALCEVLGGTSSDEQSPWQGLLNEAHAACGAQDWPQTLTAALAQPQPVDVPLARIVRRAGLSAAEALALAIGIGAEMDPAFARVVAWLQGAETGSAPTLGLLAAATAPIAGDEDIATIALVNGAAARLQLLVFGAVSGTSLSNQGVSVPAPVLRALVAGAMSASEEDAADERLPLAPTQRLAVLQGARGLAQRGGALVLRCLDRAEGHAAARVIAGALGCGAAFTTERAWTAGGAVAAAIAPTLTVFDWLLAPGERVDMARPHLKVPIVFITGLDGAVTLGGDAPAELRLAVPPIVERAQCWRQHGLDAAMVDDVARRLRCGWAQIDALAQAAAFYAACRGASCVAAEDLAQAAAALASSGFDGVGRAFESRVDDDELVLAAPARRDLERLRALCEVREQLPTTLPGGAHCAVRALFAGPSGTGKTLAARWLASRLQLPLVAVDLAALTSKWVGETEKNLAQLFARAERQAAVLLFDEADSVFGARTEVGSANDRFANNQTNYLLSRIDSFDGIVILTSNARARLDAAFARRLDVVIEFTPPGPDERRALWRLHLGADSGLTPEALERCAALIDLPGGHVRSAARAARALAMAESRAVRAADIAAALGAEYAKLGRVVPAEIGRGAIA